MPRRGIETFRAQILTFKSFHGDKITPKLLGYIVLREPAFHQVFDSIHFEDSSYNKFTLHVRKNYFFENPDYRVIISLGGHERRIY